MNMLMESLSVVLSSSPPLLNQTIPKPTKLHTSKTFSPLHSKQPHFPLKPHLPLTLMHPIISLPSFASENAITPSEQKINLEAILVSVDEFFNKYPFFVAGVTFIWLVVVPLTEEYLRKYKFISALNGFKKLKEDKSCQLLDIRDKKSLAVLGSPNLKMFNKSIVQVQFLEGEDEGIFVKKVLEKFKDPGNTTVCILDNFDGNSMKVAELLFKNGFTEAYAIKGGVRGKKGWQEIQEEFLPPSLHIYPKKKVNSSYPPKINEGVDQQKDRKDKARNGSVTNGYVKKSLESPTSNLASRSSSPYPNYPDLRPPSSPTPSKPRT